MDEGVEIPTARNLGAATMYTSGVVACDACCRPVDPNGADTVVVDVPRIMHHAAHSLRFCSLEHLLEWIQTQVHLAKHRTRTTRRHA